MDKKYQRLMKNSGIFMIANFGSKIVSFILVPFYTYVLSSGEYGTVDALVATVSLFSPIVTLGIGDVMIMFLSRKEYEVKKIFTNAAALIIFGNIMVALVYPLLLFVDIFRDYLSYFVILVVTSSVYSVLQMYARGTGKVAACAASGVIYTVTLACSNIILLLWMDMGIPGYLASTVLAYLVPAVYLFAIVPGKCFQVTLLDKDLIRNILRLSIPLIPTATLWVLMNLADKYAILWAVGASGNGVLTAVKEAGPNACPPMVVGVGVGGTFEKCALMAKEALIREVGSHSSIEWAKNLEIELLETINKTGIGPGGLGGTTTAFAVNINTYPTHIAGLPVAVNICCHVNRHIIREV